MAISAAIFIFFMRRRTRRGDTLVIDPDPIPILGASHSVIGPESNILVSNVDRTPIVGASHRPSSIAIDPDPSILISDVDHIPIVGASHPVSKDTPSNLHTGPSPNLVIEQPPQSHDTSTSPNPHIPHSSSTVSSTLPLPVSTLPSSRHISTVNDAILTNPGQSSTSESALAAEEARFLRRLYARNAPADEIAELMQAMRAREEANFGMAASSAPPAYDLSG